jgi:hypothetical protein
MTVLGVFEDLEIRVVRPNVAASAGFWFASFGNIKAVTAVADGTIAHVSIRIHISDTSAGICFRYWAAVFANNDIDTMTLHTTSFVGSVAKLRMVSAFMGLNQRSQPFLGNALKVCPEVTAVVELGDCLFMAFLTNRGRDEQGYSYRNIVMVFYIIQGHRRIGVYFVTVNTGNAFVCMAAVVPISDDAMRFRRVTFHAGASLVSGST